MASFKTSHKQRPRPIKCICFNQNCLKTILCNFQLTVTIKTNDRSLFFLIYHLVRNKETYASVIFKFAITAYVIEINCVINLKNRHIYLLEFSVKH